MSNEGVASFSRSRLILARERRGMTQRQLSALVGVSDRMVKAYESGQCNPTIDTLHKISRALSFPPSFFERPPVDALKLESASFRALTKAGAPLRHRTVAAGTLALELHRFLLERFELPRPDVPDLRNHTPESAAESLRLMWGLGQRPISNYVHLLELHGVCVFSLSEDCDSIDAFSVWRNGTPFVFLNNRKTAERSMFDAAHELGHLVMHQHGIPQGRHAEKEADAFAANFMLPASAIRAAAPRMATIASLAAMKQTWRASVAALGHRLHELGLMSDWHYKQFNIELSRRGRHNEPAPLARETSALLRKALAALSEEGIGIRDIARELCMPVSDVQSLSFGLQLVEGSGDGSGTPRGTLRSIT
ncbi:helix-turn-helix domain-containing protein [Sorangium sp. So ce204]|uniref:helix-turn-helix domain-containing protein n=1 Tax=Sorangium sp. So ce204 TaxID=3133288 RepID=UPI003F5D996B